MNSICGDAFWLIHVPGAAPRAIDACGAAAAAASIAWYAGRGITGSIPFRGGIAAIIDRGRAAPWGAGKGPADTAWMGVIDGDGRAVSFIQSTYHEYGSGVVLKHSGIVWHNRGCSFTLDADALNALRPRGRGSAKPGRVHGACRRDRAPCQRRTRRRRRPALRRRGSSVLTSALTCRPSPARGARGECAQRADQFTTPE